MTDLKEFIDSGELAAAVSRRPRWHYEPETCEAHLSTGTSRNEMERPTGPWAMVSYSGGGPYGGYSWIAHPAASHKPALGLEHGVQNPDAALDAAERAVDAAVKR